MYSFTSFSKAAISLILIRTTTLASQTPVRVSERCRGWFDGQFFENATRQRCYRRIWWTTVTVQSELEDDKARRPSPSKGMRHQAQAIGKVHSTVASLGLLFFRRLQFKHDSHHLFPLQTLIILKRPTKSWSPSIRSIMIFEWSCGPELGLVC